jgi:two-component system nitrogen regulation sensor histidine kinase GlnL
MAAVPVAPFALDARRVLEQLDTAVALLDQELRFCYANGAFCELFDAGLPKLRETSVAEWSRSGQALAAIAARARADGAAVTARGERLANGAGHAFGADVIASPSADGVLLEVHRVAPEGAVATPPRLSESLRGLAHEVKNPLAGLRGAAQLLKRRLAEPELQRLAEMIIGEADRLAALADRLLHGGRKPHLTALNLHEVIERARAVIASEASVPIERDYDPSLPPLRGDADRLLQVVLNLLRNALQAGAAHIGVRTRAAHNVLVGDQPVRLAVRLDISDDGRGVPDALRDTLFLPLVSGRADGSGLGLALAQEIAREHGGAITHGGEPGQTVFTLLLPLAGDTHG